ncbi:MAG: AAA family ATPase, partial [Acidobacteriota bacterium]
GKTTLIEDFLGEVAASGERCLIARACCSERLTGTGAALPWLEALDSLVQIEALAHGRTRSHKGSIITALRTLAPHWHSQLSTRSGDDTETPRSAEDRTVSQEGLKLELSALLHELTRAQPLVIFLDDLHWADASTSDLLTYLLSRLSSLPVLIVATYRPTEMHLSGHPLMRFKPNWQARGMCRDMPLRFLSAGEIDQYLALEFPQHTFPPRFSALIHRRTEGSPLFMAELVRDLRNRRLIVYQDGCWQLTQSLLDVEGGLPESICGMIESKIAQLNERELRLLEAASVQGNDFDSAVLSTALCRDPIEVEESLAILERIKNLVSFVEEKDLPNGTVTVRYRFVHVLYQEALFGQLQPSRITDLSARIAEAMLTYWGERSTEVASQLAILFEASRDWRRAASSFLLSALQASRFSASRDAVFIARRGLAALRRLTASPANRELELELQVILGISLIISGNWESSEVEAALDRAHELGEGSSANANRLAAEWGRIVAHCVHGRFQAARSLGENLLELALQTGDPAQIVVARSVLGTVLVQLGELKAGTEHLWLALALYEQNHISSHPALAAVDFGVRCRCYLARGLWLLGWPEKGRRCIEDALNITQQTPAGGLVMLCLLSACTVHQFLREGPTCQELSERVI